MEFFPDGLAGIARAKYELVQELPGDGLAVLNADDPYVKEFGRGMGKRAVFMA
jgi:UDP-N-acetylmuramoyl-tripeptide--D-alanyl-D-alanine ligase